MCRIPYSIVALIDTGAERKGGRRRGSKVPFSFLLFLFLFIVPDPPLSDHFRPLDPCSPPLPPPAQQSRKIKERRPTSAWLCFLQNNGEINNFQIASHALEQKPKGWPFFGSHFPLHFFLSRKIPSQKVHPNQGPPPSLAWPGPRVPISCSIPSPPLRAQKSLVWKSAPPPSFCALGRGSPLCACKKETGKHQTPTSNLSHVCSAYKKIILRLFNWEILNLALNPSPPPIYERAEGRIGSWLAEKKGGNRVRQTSSPLSYL